jgi:hypothetical protein
MSPGIALAARPAPVLAARSEMQEKVEFLSFWRALHSVIPDQMVYQLNGRMCLLVPEGGG